MPNKIDLVYFSWRGNTKKVVEAIFEELKESKVNLVEIKPKRNYPYIIWLLLSFIPNLGVEIDRIELTSNTIILSMPKWTFNCPPITSFLKQVELQGKTVYLVITYGGFDEKRYAKYYANKIKRLGGSVEGILLIRRSEVERSKERIVEFVKKLQVVNKSVKMYKE
ncbi:hypothetical protein DRP05_06410 [Archaeoglobales archaeon]|nr:MAG: hypothetical protein DRP05_06410 [Archaeoglobales archaeon]